MTRVNTTPARSSSRRERSRRAWLLAHLTALACSGCIKVGPGEAGSTPASASNQPASAADFSDPRPTAARRAGGSVAGRQAGPCAGISCSGHGTCGGSDTEAVCHCEAGYHADWLTCAADVQKPAGAKAYHVSPQGDDSADGLSPTSPLKSIAKALSKAQPGDSVVLRAGATFNEPIKIHAGGGRPGRPITITSDPSSRAKIAISGTKQEGILLENSQYVTIENLVVSGPGASQSEARGVNAAATKGQYEGLVFKNLDVSGFHEGLILVSWEKPTDGFHNVSIEDCDLHDNAADGGSTFGTAPGAMRDIIVRRSRFFNNLGDPKAKTPSGSGFVMGGVDNGLIEYCLAHHNGGQGAQNGGPVGLWAYDSKRVTIQFSESHHHKAQHQDGDGFDLDIGVTDSVLQYNYAHDNFGSGFLLYAAEKGEWKNNVVRFNISENDGYGGKMAGLEIASAPNSPGIQSSWVYGNTVYSAVSPALKLTYEANVTGVQVFNNIFVTAKDQPLVVSTGTPSKDRIKLQSNLYWASGGKVSLEGKDSMDAWRKATGQETDGSTATGLFADPLLARPGQGGSLDAAAKLATFDAYRLLKGSPAIDAGVEPLKFGALPTDRDFFGVGPVGERRDLGAAEFTRGPTPERKAGTPLRIMPIGDSITEFAKQPIDVCPGGYRYELWKQLIDAGLSFDLVGSHNMGREWAGQDKYKYPPYKGRTFDDDNNAWGGFTTTDVLQGKTKGWGEGAGNLDRWLEANDADVVLLHIGTNDSWTGVAPEKYAANVRAIIRKLQARNPRIRIYLAKLIPFGSKLATSAGALVPKYNALLDGIAAELSTKTSKVSIVDQSKGYVPDEDNACDKDNVVHPGISGAQKMAKRWVSAILADFPAGG